jgi:hypothetical protein
MEVSLRRSKTRQYFRIISILTKIFRKKSEKKVRGFEKDGGGVYSISSFVYRGKLW